MPRPGLATDRLLTVYDKGLTPGAPERIYTKYSDDRGQTWLTGQLDQPSTPPDGAMHGFPAAIADASGVRVTWMDNRANPTCTSASSPGACGTWHVWSRTSPDGVSGWTPEVRLDQRSGFGFPYGDYQSLALDSSGNTYAVWGEGPDEAGPGNIFFTRS